MKENIETKDVQRTEYLDKNGLDMLWAKVKENTHNQVEAERDRALGQEIIIIETKADKSELHNYVSDTALKALEKKVSANTTAISNKQDAGNYLSYQTLNNEGYYEIPDIRITGNGGNTKTDIDSQSISVKCDVPDGYTTITCDGISNNDNNANHVFATDGSIADLTQYAKKTDIPEVDTSDFVSKTTTDAQSLKSELSVSNTLSVVDSSSSKPVVMLGTNGDDTNFVMINPNNEEKVIWVTPTHIQIGQNLENSMFISRNSIQSPDNDMEHVFTTAGTIANLFEYVRKENIGDGLNINDDGVVSVDTTAIGAGNYIPYESVNDNVNDKTYVMKHNEGILFKTDTGNTSIKDNEILITNTVNRELSLTSSFIWLQEISDNGNSESLLVELNEKGLRLRGGDNDHVLTSYGSTIDITRYALKSELPTVPTKVSQLQNDSEFITKSVYDEKITALEARIAALEAKHAALEAKHAETA